MNLLVVFFRRDIRENSFKSENERQDASSDKDIAFWESYWAILNFWGKKEGDLGAELAESVSLFHDFQVGTV